MSIYRLYMENQTNILSIKRVIDYLVCVRTLEPPCIYIYIYSGKRLLASSILHSESAFTRGAG